MINKKTQDAIKYFWYWNKWEDEEIRPRYKSTICASGNILADAVEKQEKEIIVLKELLGQCRSAIREDYKCDNRNTRPIIIISRESLIARIEEKLK